MPQDWAKSGENFHSGRYNSEVLTSRILWMLFCAGAFLWPLWAQPPIYPLKDIRPGMKGVGKTVFRGDKIEDFDAEILGVLENIGPKQSIILARLSGGPLASTGVMQGMSGSPVYIEGKLAGAVAFAFSFSKEPIAGIRPIEEMLTVPQHGPVRSIRASLPWNTDSKTADLTAMLPPPPSPLGGEAKLIEIATPVSFAGFTERTLEFFGPKLRALGLEPRQGVGSGAPRSTALGNPSALKPGSMISVQLLSGDMAVGADGTVTHIDGSRIYAFGHRFLSIGSTELPFARAEVLTLLPNLSTSFKISTAKEWMGTITQDRNVAVAGELGRRATLVPVSITVKHPNRAKDHSYRMSMVNDRFLSPLLIQMAIFSAIDATERTVGASSFAIKGSIELDGADPIRISNMFAGDVNVPLQVSMAGASPLAYVLQSSFSDLKLKSVSLAIEAFDQKKQLEIDEVWASRQQVRPGETIEITAVLRGENGQEVSKTVAWTVPIGAASGPLYFTVADGATTNLSEYRRFLTEQPKSPAQLVSFLNRLRENTGAYVRIWRPDAGFQVQGEDLPSPPPSVALMLAKQQGAVPQAANSKLDELAIPVGSAVISGAKTIQVEVKE